MLTKIVNHIRGQYLGALALFVALGGTSYAAITFPSGSVGTRQLRNGSVTASKLARGAVSPPKLSSAIAGHIAMLAQIRADGSVVSSSPRATVVPYAVSGIERVTWNRSVSPRCIALANPTNLGPSSATASATGPYPHPHSTQVVISTFSGSGALTPENVNVVVICP